MNHKRLLRMSAVAAVVMGLGAQAPAAYAADPAEPGERAASPSTTRKLPTNTLIIRYKPATPLVDDDAPHQPRRMDRLSRAVGVPVFYLRAMSGNGHVIALPSRLEEDEVRVIARRIMQQVPDIEFAEPDRIMRRGLVPNDVNFGSQWHYGSPAGFGANVQNAWDVTTGLNVVVAVIDTGILFNHPDLPAGRVLAGYDFISDRDKANDGDGRDGNAADPGDWITASENASGEFKDCGVTNSSWHGTHVAGTIGAVSNNARNVAGINWNVRILPVRVLGKCGGKTSDIADGMRWAAGLHVNGVPDNLTPAKILNLSFSGPGDCSNSFKNAIEDVRGAGAIVVVAAGNDSDLARDYEPAVCHDVITVGATDQAGNKAWFSNFGPWVEISAPGVNVWSTGNAGTRSPGAMTSLVLQGTSQAAPHVSGIISLILSVRPGLSQSYVLDLIKETATPFAPGNTCITTIFCGAGIVDALSAVRNIYVDKNANSLTQLGLPANPWRSISFASATAWDGAWLLIKPGTYDEAITIDKKVTLTVDGTGTVTIGR